jgi:hypothetical protein
MRPPVIWLLLLAIPFHTLTAVYLDLRGPAHFHLHGELDEDGRGHPHHHGSEYVERHHHPGADLSVVTVEGDAALDAHPLEEGASPGWSSTMCVALVSAAASLHVPRLASAIAPGRDPLLQTRFLGRVERPPRLDRV